jgi:hypothetical protein
MGTDGGAREAPAGAGDDEVGVDNMTGQTENTESEIGGCKPPLQDSRSSPPVGKFDLPNGVGTVNAGTVLHATTRSSTVASLSAPTTLSTPPSRTTSPHTTSGCAPSPGSRPSPYSW